MAVGCTTWRTEQPSVIVVSFAELVGVECNVLLVGLGH